MTTVVTLPRRTRATTEAQLAATEGGTSTQTDQRIFNGNTSSAGGNGGQSPQWVGDAQGE